MFISNIPYPKISIILCRKYSVLSILWKPLSKNPIKRSSKMLIKKPLTPKINSKNKINFSIIFMQLIKKNSIRSSLRTKTSKKNLTKIKEKSNNFSKSQKNTLYPNKSNQQNLLTLKEPNAS